MKTVLILMLILLLIAACGYFLHKGVKAKAYSADGTYGGAAKSIFRRQPK